MNELNMAVNNYRNLLNSCRTLLNQLNNAKNNIEDCKNIGSYYSVEDVAFGFDDIVSVSNDLSNSISNIRDKVIPSIEQKIRTLNVHIEQLREEEMQANSQ